jgi:hypothetical protein
LAQKDREVSEVIAQSASMNAELQLMRPKLDKYQCEAENANKQ